MNAIEVIGLIATIIGLIGVIEVRIKALVKNYLIELKPNHGSSLRDKVDRLEQEMNEIRELLKIIVSKM